MVVLLVRVMVVAVVEVIMTDWLVKVVVVLIVIVVKTEQV